MNDVDNFKNSEEFDDEEELPKRSFVRVRTYKIISQYFNLLAVNKLLNV